MIQFIEDFRGGYLQYFEFVGALEGALDSCEFYDESLVEKWYDFWTPLESLRAQRGNNVTVDDVTIYLSAMESFLRNILDEAG